MGMFTKVIAFLDKAAGVPVWVTYADNIRKLQGRGCPTLAKAIVEKSSFHYMASMSVEEVVPELAFLLRGADAGMMQLVHEVIAAAEGPVEGPLQVLYDFVEVAPPASSEDEDLDDEEDREDALAPLQTDRELSERSIDTIVEEQAVVDAVESSLAVLENEMEVFRGKLQEASTDLIQAPLVASVEDLAETISLTGGLSEEECLATVPGAALNPQVRMQLIQGMMKVISRGRKPGPTLKVLKTMACEDQAAITEALEEMAKQGNRLASAILEDPSL